ncbi:MAG: hypothetical protein ACT4TC_06680 [Myxococcaceae bacterium]
MNQQRKRERDLAPGIGVQERGENPARFAEDAAKPLESNADLGLYG